MKPPKLTTMTTLTRKNFLLCLALIGVSAASLSAQSNTVPAGYFTVNINAGSGSSYGISDISFPLQDTATATGQMVGVVTGVTANTITNSNGGWTAAQLSQAVTPYLIQFTSGAASGRTLLLSTTVSNTTTTLTLDPTEATKTDLTTLGIVAGTDTYQIIPGDTISGVFGTPASGVQGGTSAATADQLQIFSTSSTWITYYYKTDAATPGWVRSGPNLASGNVVIRPDTGVIYSRLAATPMSIVLMGRVPSVDRKALVSNSNVTFLSNNWPVDTTLANSKLQNILTTGPNSTVADTVQVFSPSHTWISYYHNGTNWARVGPNINSDAVLLPAGSAVVISRKGSTAGSSVVSQTLPYSL